MFLSHRWRLSGAFLYLAGYLRSVFMGAFLAIVSFWRWAWTGDSDSDTATGMWAGALGTCSWAAAREFCAGYLEAVSLTGTGSRIGAWKGWFRFLFDTLVLSDDDIVLNTDCGTGKETLLRLQYSSSLFVEGDWCVDSAVGDQLSLSRYFGYSQSHVGTVPTFWLDYQNAIYASKKRS